MKKILSLILCVVIAITMLASCSEETFGDYEYPGYVPTVIPNIKLDVHIIIENGTKASNGEVETLATKSVERMLSQYTETKFNTKLDVHYITASDYADILSNDLAKTGDAKADIILINSSALINDLVERSLLEDITPFFDGVKYGRLNTIITPNLIEASKIDGKIYSVPNDHILGEYTYLVINEAVATSYNFSPEKLTQCRSLEDETLVALKAAMDSNGENFDECVKLVSGNYSDKAVYEGQGNICNVVSNPQIDDDEAFKSAFAIAKGTEYPDRAMEILYLLNTDAEFRNMLQYGVEGINYVKADGNIVPHSEGEGVYNMSSLYTGSAFLLYYSADWTEQMKKVGELQNKDAEVVVSSALGEQ